MLAKNAQWLKNLIATKWKSIPDDVQDQLKGLEAELVEGDITEKGFVKKCSRLLTNLPVFELEQSSVVVVVAAATTTDDGDLGGEVEKTLHDIVSKVNEMNVVTTRNDCKPLQTNFFPVAGTCAVRNVWSNYNILSKAESVPTDEKAKVPDKIKQLMYTLQKSDTCESRQENQNARGSAVRRRGDNIESSGELLTPGFGGGLPVSARMFYPVEDLILKTGFRKSHVPFISSIGSNAKLLNCLTFGKLLSRSKKLAFHLLNKVGTSNKMKSLKTRDRVLLKFDQNEVLEFVVAFCGCYLAGVIPLLTASMPESVNIRKFLYKMDVKAVLSTDETCRLIKKAKHPSKDRSVIDDYGVPWMSTSSLGKQGKEWVWPNIAETETGFIEVFLSETREIRAVVLSREQIQLQCRILTHVCSYEQDDTILCTEDPRHGLGFWHAILVPLLCEMKVFCVHIDDPKCNRNLIDDATDKYNVTVAIVGKREYASQAYESRGCKKNKSRTSSVRLLLLNDNLPIRVWPSKNFLHQSRICASAVAPSAFNTQCGIFAMWNHKCSHEEGLPLPACDLCRDALSCFVLKPNDVCRCNSNRIYCHGKLLPEYWGAVVKFDRVPYLCRTDEMGELIIHGPGTPSHVFDSSGLIIENHKIQPLDSNGRPIGERQYIRTGLLGTMKGNKVFIIASTSNTTRMSDNRIAFCHDIEATVSSAIADEVASISVFPVQILARDKVVVIVEHKIRRIPGQHDDELTFHWINAILHRVNIVHHIRIFCVAVVPYGQIPRTNCNDIDTHGVRQMFIRGQLHPINILMCPGQSITNLSPSSCRAILAAPRSLNSFGSSSLVSRQLNRSNCELAAVKLVVGPLIREEIDNVVDANIGKSFCLDHAIELRSVTMPEHPLMTFINSKNHHLIYTCHSLNKKVRRMLQTIKTSGLELRPCDRVAIMIPAESVDFVAAFYACHSLGLVPVPFNPNMTSYLIGGCRLSLLRTLIDFCGCRQIMATSGVVKNLGLKDLTMACRDFPPVLEVDNGTLTSLQRRDLDEMFQRKKVPEDYLAAIDHDSACFVNFAVSNTNGNLIASEISHKSILSLCRSIKQAAEVYPSREILFSLEPYEGMSFILWSILGVFTGHQSLFIHPSELEHDPLLWVHTVHDRKIRDAFLSCSAMDMITEALKSRATSNKVNMISLATLRSVTIVSQTSRAHQENISAFIQVAESLNMSRRVVTTSLESPVNVAMCMQSCFDSGERQVSLDLDALKCGRISICRCSDERKTITIMRSGSLLPSVKLMVVHVDNGKPLPELQLGEFWVSSAHNSSSVSIGGGRHKQVVIEHAAAQKMVREPRCRLDARGDSYSRTGILGFFRRIPDEVDSNYEIYVVGTTEEMMVVRGMMYFPVDIERTVSMCPLPYIYSCVCFSWSRVVVVVVEWAGPEDHALDLVPLLTSAVIENHELIIGVVVIVDPGTIPALNRSGTPARNLLRNAFLSDVLNPIYVAYNL